jgi:hypothetical protein
MLSRKVERETEQSLVFSMGMVIYSIIMEVFSMLMGNKQVYDECDEIAIGMIIGGDTLSVKELEDQKCLLVKIIKECWNQPCSFI